MPFAEILKDYGFLIERKRPLTLLVEIRALVFKNSLLDHFTPNVDSLCRFPLIQRFILLLTNMGRVLIYNILDLLATPPPFLFFISSSTPVFLF
jgi:hypothetical protein